MNAREERAAKREAEVKAIEAEYEAADRTPETCPDCDAILPRWAQTAGDMILVIKEFIADVEAAYAADISRLEEDGWPDLVVTFEKAKAIIAKAEGTP